jgi:hypothetical protein
MFIDVAFLSDTFLKLCAALPVTLGLFICSFSAAAYWRWGFWRCA